MNTGSKEAQEFSQFIADWLRKLGNTDRSTSSIDPDLALQAVITADAMVREGYAKARNSIL